MFLFLLYILYLCYIYDTLFYIYTCIICALLLFYISFSILFEFKYVLCFYFIVYKKLIILKNIYFDNSKFFEYILIIRNFYTKIFIMSFTHTIRLVKSGCQSICKIVQDLWVECISNSTYMQAYNFTARVWLCKNYGVHLTMEYTLHKGATRDKHLEHVYMRPEVN